MKLYHQRPATLRGTTLQELDKNEVKVSPFQHALNDGCSVPSPRSGRGGGQVSTPGNCQKEKALACARKQTAQLETVALITCQILSPSPPCIQDSQGDTEEGGLSSFSCWLSYVGTSLGTSFILPRGLFKPHYPQDSDMPPWEVMLPILKAENH